MYSKWAAELYALKVSLSYSKCYHEMLSDYWVRCQVMTCGTITCCLSMALTKVPGPPIYPDWKDYCLINSGKVPTTKNTGSE